MSDKAERFLDYLINKGFGQLLKAAYQAGDSLLDEPGSGRVVRGSLIDTCLRYISLYEQKCLSRIDVNHRQFMVRVITFLLDARSPVVPSSKSDYTQTLDAWPAYQQLEWLEKMLYVFVKHPNNHVPDILNILSAYDRAEPRTNYSAQYLEIIQALVWELIHIDNYMSDLEREFYVSCRQEMAMAASSCDQLVELPRSHFADLSGHDAINHRSVSDEPLDLAPASSASAPQKTDERSYESVIEDVNSLVGLDSIKREFISLGNLLKVQQLRKQQGMPVIDQSMHMVFYGNPGTGKTTIARKVGEVYRSLGLLSKGHLIETDRSGLVAGYLGQTAIKTTETLRSALGGILFIDEAYSLVGGSDQDSYGKEAIDTIVKFMEDHREDIVIIVAGYKDQMGRFVGSNPGLRSRFTKYFSFPDYTSRQLTDIFMRLAAKSHYRLVNGAEARVSAFMQVLEMRKLGESRSEGFGNARIARTLFERSVANQSNRIMSISDLSRDHLMEIEPSDFDGISLDDFF